MTRAALRQLATTEAFKVLKTLAEILCHQHAGIGLPGTSEQERRFLNAAIMRRGYELLWMEVDRQGKQAARESSSTQQLFDALTSGPVERTVEIEKI